MLFLLSEKNFQKTINFRWKISFFGKGMNLKGGCQRLSVETMLIRKSLIHSIRIALWDKLELVGTRAILEKRTLLSGNFDHSYYFLDFFLVSRGFLVDTMLILTSTNHSIRNALCDNLERAILEKRRFLWTILVKKG